jgi:AcrR family transcriptional regulator
MTLKRKAPAVRKDEILAAAISLAAASSYTRVTRDQIAKGIGVTGTAVQYHFGTMGQLRTAIMRSAVKRAVSGQSGATDMTSHDRGEFLRVVAQGLLDKEPHAMRAPDWLKTEARGSI